MTFLGSLPVLVFGYVSGLRIIFAYRAWAEAVAAERFRVRTLRHMQSEWVILNAPEPKARLHDMLKAAGITGATWVALGAAISWAIGNT